MATRPPGFAGSWVEIEFVENEIDLPMSIRIAAREVDDAICLQVQALVDGPAERALPDRLRHRS
jgi:hypothetical protein